MPHGSTLERRDLGGARVVHRSPALAELGVPHAFTTRSAWDGAAPAEDLVRMLEAPAGARLVQLEQVHGADVHRVTDEGPAPDACGDALVGERPDRVLLIRTADCVPVLASAPDGRRVAAVHAGWRGLVAGVLPAALEVLGWPFDAAIGPCLSTARFEVGPEVAERFAAVGLADAVVEGFGPRPHVDLRLAACLQLERAGARRVDVSDRCTWDDPELFSYRRDVTHGGQPATGRLGALIAPRG